MKNIIWIIAGLALALAFYFIGKNAGKNDVRTELVQNISIIKEIAEAMQEPTQVFGNVLKIISPRIP